MTFIYNGMRSCSTERKKKERKKLPGEGTQRREKKTLFDASLVECSTRYQKPPKAWHTNKDEQGASFRRGKLLSNRCHVRRKGAGASGPKGLATLSTAQSPVLHDFC